MVRHAQHEEEGSFPWPNLDGTTVYDLAQPLHDAIPGASVRGVMFSMALIRRHGDKVWPDGLSGAGEMIVTTTHIGTHIDGLAHVSHEGKLYGGEDAYEAQRGGRFAKLGIDQLNPIVCRGVLLDVAALHGTACLASGTGISAEDLRGAAEREGVAVREGDAVLVRTGWSAKWSDPMSYLPMDSGMPGVDLTGARQVAEWGARVTGADTMGYEHVRLGEPHRSGPVHRILLFEHGIYIIENLNLEELARDRVYEFMFVVTPLKLVGATGSPVRPIAIDVRCASRARD